MARQTLVQLTDPLVERLDRRAAREGVSRSRVIRDAVEAYLHDDQEAEIARRYREGYQRIPAGTEDEWGDPEAFHAGLVRARAREPTGEDDGW